MHQETPETIIKFWFKNESRWFKKDAQFDENIRARFQDLWLQAKEGKYAHWQDTPAGILALVIIFDQLPRNMFRGGAQMYATDNNALQLVKAAIINGTDLQLESNKQRFCLYMPFMHSEVLADQEKGIVLFQQVDNHHAVSSAEQHRDIVKKFGRFPHRNAILGRTSSAEELEFLKNPKAHF
ncbi:MAG: hypothetical protein COC15_03900 [Legionellales bacterium]|nr:MAG: hypothetical protein COC15_03900 [Legionellales bacterium]